MPSMRNLGLLFVVACGSSGHRNDVPDSATGTSDSSRASDAAIATHDDDADGLDDAFELQLAIDYMPFVSMDPQDGCALDGMVVRVRPHPADPTKILIVYDHLFQNDCGLGGHIGDDEVFGISVDPKLPAPTGILAIRAASHQGTACERDTECTTCSNDSRSACELAADGGAMWPIVYASKAKHGQYANKCSALTTCLDQCTLNAMRAHPPVVNAGEPGHPLVTDLTTQGFITAANGWTEATLQHFDPWVANKNFGGAGNIASDLQDAAFEAAPCQ
jgi:hypothetical protein